MLHAIERLTNLYDLSKAFGSTIDIDELPQLIVRKAADFVTAEVASPLDARRESDVTVSATAVNENYDVESPPDAVGAAIVGDVVADQEADPPQPHPAEPTPSPPRTPATPSVPSVAVPLIEDDVAIGALVVANKRGRHPEFSAEDEELLGDLARQAVRALRNARQHEAEKKVEELDALLAVSREITATLDLDKVMQTIVNATSALIAYDRCGIAIQEKGKLRLGSDLRERRRSTGRTPEVQPHGGAAPVGLPVGDGHRRSRRPRTAQITADRPETEEKFRALFAETGLRSFYGVLLKDEEGKLGVSGLREQGAVGLRRGDTGPALDPRQPGHGRRPQRAALPAGAARRILEAAARETPRKLAAHPDEAPARLGRRHSASPPRALRRALAAAASRGPRAFCRAAAPR